MIEATTQPEIQRAFVKAHEERAKAFAQVMVWIMKPLSVPLGAVLNEGALTEPSR